MIDVSVCQTVFRFSAGSAPDAVNTRSSDRGLTPLMLSSIRGHYPVVETLLKHK